MGTTVLSTETDHNLPSCLSLESYRTLIDSRVIEENDREIRKYRETSENRNMMYQNQWDATKVVLRRKCIAIYNFFKKGKKVPNNFSLKGIGKRTNKAQNS